MRLTNTLCKQNLYRVMKGIMAAKVRTKKPPLIKPKFLNEEDIIDPAEKSTVPVPNWKPPVEDDPRFIRELKPLHERKNYNEQKMHCATAATRLSEGINHACVLTKTQVLEGLPERVQSLIGVESVPDQDLLIQRKIMHAHVWDTTKEKLPKRFDPQLPGWKFKPEYGTPDNQIMSLLTVDLLRLCSTLSEKYPSLLTRKLSRDHHINVPYDFNGVPVIIRGTHPYFLSDNSELLPFADEATVDQSTQHQLPNMYPLSPLIDIHKQTFYTTQHITGWKSDYTFNAPHTLFIGDSFAKFWALEQTVARSILVTFGYATSYAKQKYGNDVTTLPEPVSIQCIHTDGIKFGFICFQLNTLDFSTQNGVKNLVWFDNYHKMFEKNLPRRAMLRNTKYEEYDPAVFQKILAFYLNGAKVIQT